MVSGDAMTNYPYKDTDELLSPPKLNDPVDKPR